MNHIKIENIDPKSYKRSKITLILFMIFLVFGFGINLIPNGFKSNTFEKVEFGTFNENTDIHYFYNFHIYNIQTTDFLEFDFSYSFNF